MTDFKYGWYNSRSSETCIYLTQDGKSEVEVSFVEDEYNDYHRANNIYVGRVTTCVRMGRVDGREQAWLRSRGEEAVPVKSGGGVSKAKFTSCYRKYNGTGTCTCGTCNVKTTTTPAGRNPFQYSKEDQESWRRTHPVTPQKSDTGHDDAPAKRECEYGQF